MPIMTPKSQRSIPVSSKVSPKCTTGTNVFCQKLLSLRGSEGSVLPTNITDITVTWDCGMAKQVFLLTWLTEWKTVVTFVVIQTKLKRINVLSSILDQAFFASKYISWTFLIPFKWMVYLMCFIHH